MKKIVMALVLATLGGSAVAEPLSFDLSKSYVAAMGSYQRLEKARPADSDGFGVQFSYGLPVSEFLSLEATVFGTYMPRDIDNKADLSEGLGLDLLVAQRNESFSTFLLAGAGAVHEDISKVESVAPYVNIGAGLFGRIPFLPGFSYRAEVRGVVDINKDGAPGAGKDTLIEPRLNVGLVYGFDYSAAVPPPALPTDSDGDGVLDASDLCPNTPPGAAVDATGCPAAAVDTDGDGVVDPIDQCPGTLAGTVVDATGCPPPVAPPVSVNPDLDGDGVLNELDKCPGTPPSFKVDVIGCMVEQTVALQNVNFEFGSDELTAGAKTLLDGIAGSLLAQTSVKVLVTGHTDALGPQSYNLQLSQRRAKAVLAYLSGKGVEAARLSAEGEGEFSPIATNDTEEGRAQNRRVEFKITAQ